MTLLLASLSLHTPNPVILSGGESSLRELSAESKDPYELVCRPGPGQLFLIPLEIQDPKSCDSIQVYRGPSTSFLLPDAKQKLRSG